MITYYVESFEKVNRFFPFFKTKDTTYYLFVYHSDLNIFKNIMINIPLALIEERK